MADSRKSYINSHPKGPGVKSLLKATHWRTKRPLQPRGRMSSMRWWAGWQRVAKLEISGKESVKPGFLHSVLWLQSDKELLSLAGRASSW